MSKEEIMQKNKERIESLGLEYGGHLIPENYNDDRRVIKVNLPDCEQDWASGNGEGCWGYLRREEDLEKYDKGEGDFEIILMNYSFYYPNVLTWGTIILAEGRGRTNRPVMKKDWIDAVLQRIGDIKDDEVEFISDDTE